MSTMTIEQLADRLREVRATRLQRAVVRELESAALDAEGVTKDFARQRMTARSGHLFRSIQAGAEVRGGSPVLFLRAGGGTNEVRYAGIQEYGGVVTPRRGKFLAIPTDLVPGGRTPQPPRDFPFLRFVPIRGGAAGLLVKDLPGRGKRGTGARSEVWYRLVRSVTIREKRFLRDGFDSARVDVRERLARRVAALVGGRDGQ